MKDSILYNCIKRKFIQTFICIIISTLSLFCIQFSDINGIGFKKIFSYILGIIFWGGIICEQILFWKINYKVKHLKKTKQHRTYKEKKSRIGLISFFQNKEAAFFDLLFIISTILFIILSLCRISNEILILSCVSVLFLSFSFHCLLNGKNYIYIKGYKKGEIYDE